MPKEKNWETIFEDPVTKKGKQEYQSNKKFKRYCNFDDFYNQNRLKKRRQKALKRGWKPLTKKKEQRVEKLVEEKIMALDEQLIEEELPDTSISETLSLLSDPLVSLPVQKGETSVTASPVKSAMSQNVGVSESDHKVENLVDVAVTLDTRSDIDRKSLGNTESSKVLSGACALDNSKDISAKSSQSDSEFFTPKASMALKQSSNEGVGALSSTLCAISEVDQEEFFTPAAKMIDNRSQPVELSPESSEPKSAHTSDTLSPTKTQVKPEAAADVSGVYSLSP